MYPGLPELAGLMDDLWKFLKFYYASTDWKKIIEDAERMAKVHDYDLTKEIMLVIVDFLDRKSNDHWKSDPVKVLYERLKK